MYGEAMRMDLSGGSAFIMAVVIVVALAAFIAIVLFASRRPYFKNRPGRPRTTVSGGVHEGDPRSVTPRHEEYLEPPDRRR